jgi:hypothetical protein
MSLQSGEIIVGDWEVYRVRSRYPSYIAGIPVINELAAPFQYPILNPPFAGDYDRVEILHSQYRLEHELWFTAYYTDGSIANDGAVNRSIKTYSYSESPVITPVEIPYPTFSSIAPSQYEGAMRVEYRRPIGRLELDLIVQKTRTELTYNFYGTNPTIIRLWPTISLNGTLLGDRITIVEEPLILRYYKRAPKPHYIHLLSGYPLDDRIVANNPQVISPQEKVIKIGYYRENQLESIPELRTIDWMTYECKLQADVAYQLPLFDCVLGTLNISDPEITSLLISGAAPEGFYPYKYYFESNLPDLFEHWLSLWGVSTETNNVRRVLRILGANNNVWVNRTVSTPDLNIGNIPNDDIPHPMVTVDAARTQHYYFNLQTDGSYGNLTMDSPRILEIHAALNAAFYAARAVTNLGYFIHKIANLLGHRPDADGQIEEAIEKSDRVRTAIEGNAANDPLEYNPNGFGSKGMLVRHMPNKFSPGGTVKAGGYRRVFDIPQLLAEYHEQANAAVGYQEGTAIEITIEGEKYTFPNQLALLTELFCTLKQTQTYAKGGFFSSVVSEQSIKEVMAGLGLRTVDKYIEFNVAGKAAKLYYKGISASQSLRRKLSALATNLGITNGNVS